MESRPLWNPYVAGVALGLVLLASFLVMGFGLGSSGAVTRIGVGAAHAIAPEAVEHNGYFARYFNGTHILDNWMVYLFLGLFAGGLAGAYSGGRLKTEVVRGERRMVSRWQRLGLALLGGVLMGVAARFARGCTSGQALSGGALLSVGSWVFMLAVFAGGYLMAPVVRREWR
ncbi:MAG: YeeE/YedE thiosulfate transporter family protein [Candidatus Latescibacterota bacterium]|jgi:hypothetical protein